MEKNKTKKLDFKTWLYLFITNAIRVEHPTIVKVDTKRAMLVKESKRNEIFIFDNYEEYRNYYLMYLDSIEDELIDLAIYTKGNRGQVIALKGLCEYIIIKKKMNEFYRSITQEQIDEIHLKGELTPLEAVQMWESFNLCVDKNSSISSNERCKFFDENCHECLLELASHKLEYEPIELNLNDSIKEKYGLILKK